MGEIRGARARIELSYDETWRSGGFPLSLRLPLESGYHDASAFFTGLLPEGRARHRLCRQLRLGEDDDLGLLLAIVASTKKT